MFKISLSLLGCLFILLISPHIASGFKAKAAIGWKLAKAACAQSVAYVKTQIIQKRLKHQSQHDSGGTETCTNLTRTNCESPGPGCKRFECKGKREGGGGGGGGGGADVQAGGQKQPKGKPLPHPALIDAYGVGNMQTVDLTGKFSWSLLFDMNNTGNKGSHHRKNSYLTEIESRYTELVKATASVALSAGFHAGVDVKLGVIDFKSKFDFDATMEFQIHKTLRKTTTTSESFNAQVEYSVGPDSILLLYQLLFNVQGYDRRYLSLSSFVSPKPNKIIKSDFYYKSYLKDVRVYVGADNMDVPEQVVLGYDPNVIPELNLGFNGYVTYFVPVWSEVAEDRIYGLQVHVETFRNENLTSISSGNDGPNRYITGKKDYNDQTAITRLVLFRTTNANENPAMFGLNDCTSNINAGRGVSWLHLCWFSMVLSPGPVPPTDPDEIFSTSNRPSARPPTPRPSTAPPAVIP